MTEPGCVWFGLQHDYHQHFPSRAFNMVRNDKPHAQLINNTVLTQYYRVLCQAMLSRAVWTEDFI